MAVTGLEEGGPLELGLLRCDLLHVGRERNKERPFYVRALELSCVAKMMILLTSQYSETNLTLNVLGTVEPHENMFTVNRVFPVPPAPDLQNLDSDAEHATIPRISSYPFALQW